MWGNECLWSIENILLLQLVRLPVLTVYLELATTTAFQAATEGANPVQWTIEGSFSATTNVNARRVIIYAHGGFR